MLPIWPGTVPIYGCLVMSGLWLFSYEWFRYLWYSLMLGVSRLVQDVVWGMADFGVGLDDGLS